MKLLLDTHALLWFAIGDSRMPVPIRKMIADPAHAIWVSPASHWGIAIEISVGKYVLPTPFIEFLNEAVQGNGFEYLPVTTTHTEVVATLPFHRRAQATVRLARAGMPRGGLCWAAASWLS